MPKKSKRSKAGWVQFKTDDLKKLAEEQASAEQLQKAAAELTDESLYFEQKAVTTDLDALRKERKLRNRKKANEIVLHSIENDPLVKPISKDRPKGNIVTYEQRKIENLIKTPIQLQEQKELTTEERVLQIWGNDEKGGQPKRKKRKIILPHPGQSYNPDKMEHQMALHTAHTEEKLLLDRGKSFLKYLDSGKRERKKPGGDDVLDGIKAQEAHEEKSNEPIPPKPKPKPRKVMTLTKKLNIRREQQRLRRKRLKKKKLEEPSVASIVEEINKPSKKAEKKRKRMEKYLEKKKNPKAFQPVKGADDVVLTEDLPSSLRTLETNLVNVWQDQLKTMHNRGDIHIPNINSVEVKPGLIVKQKL